MLSLAALGACSDERPSERGAQTPAPSLITEQIPAGFPTGSITQRAPGDNELTEARAQLGKRLFYDTRLARTSDVAPPPPPCATCHEQEYAFAEPDVFSTGVEERRGTRNAPALMNLAWSESFLGRARAHVGGASRQADREPRRDGSSPRPGGHPPRGRSELRLRVPSSLRGATHRGVAAKSDRELRPHAGERRQRLRSPPAR